MKQSEIEVDGVYTGEYGTRGFMRRVFEVGTGEGMVWEKGEALVLYTIGNDPRTSPDGAETLAEFARWAQQRVR